MAQYIDKDALVGKIKHHIKEESHSYFCKCLLSEIDTLEVKEVDLEKEIQAFSKMELEPIKVYDANVSLTITMHSLYQCAKHFFELGLKAQKGE